MEIIEKIRQILETENPKKEMREKVLDVAMIHCEDEEKTFVGDDEEIVRWVRKGLCEHGFIGAKIDLLTKGVPYEKLELFDEVILEWQRENAQKINALFPQTPSLYRSLPEGVDPEPELDF